MQIAGGKGGSTGIGTLLAEPVFSLESEGTAAFSLRYADITGRMGTKFRGELLAARTRF